MLNANREHTLCGELNCIALDVLCGHVYLLETLYDIVNLGDR